MKNLFESIARISLLSLCFLVSSIVFSQQSELKLDYRHQLGMTFFKLEQNEETLNNQFEPKFYTGLFYEFKPRKFSWYSSVEWGENEIIENCKNCADLPYGNMIMKELNVFSGIGYHQSVPLFKRGFDFLFRVKGFASAINYSGRYEGGFSGGVYSRDRRYYILGLQLEAGVAYAFTDHFLFRLDCAFRAGKSWQKDKYPLNQSVSSSKYLSGAYTLPSIGLGYRF